MKIITPALLAVLSAAPALGQEAQKLDVTFTWAAFDIETQDAGATQAVAIGASDLVFTGEGGSPFDKLVGHCLFLRRFDLETQEYGSHGDCALADAEGDRVFLRFEEASGAGKGAIASGTGKFADLSSEFAYELPWFGSAGEGRNSGRGRLTGTWARSAP